MIFAKTATLNSLHAGYSREITVYIQRRQRQLL